MRVILLRTVDNLAVKVSFMKLLRAAPCKNMQKKIDFPPAACIPLKKAGPELFF
jgi:hypothetical protein